MPQPEMISRFRLSLAMVVLAAIGIYIAYWQNTGKDQIRVEIVRAGIAHLSIRKTVGGVPVWLDVLKIRRKKGWRLRVALADRTIFGKTTVKSMAHTHHAIAAVNGGYFADNGAPVGALCMEGEWIRLPWKNRTALGIAKNGDLRIGSLSAVAVAEFENGDQLPLAQINGSPVLDGLTALTPRFATSYTLRSKERAVLIEHGRVLGIKDTGVLSFAEGSWAIIATGEASPQLEALHTGQKAQLRVEPQPSFWKDYPTLLGAGPRLIEKGSVLTTEVEEEFREDVLRRNSRTALGVTSEGDLLLLSCPLDAESSMGLTLSELANEMKELGAVSALNLDGGASVSMVIGNKPMMYHSHELEVSNVLLVLKE